VIVLKVSYIHALTEACLIQSQALSWRDSAVEATTPTCRTGRLLRARLAVRAYCGGRSNASAWEDSDQTNRRFDFSALWPVSLSDGHTLQHHGLSLDMGARSPEAEPIQEGKSARLQTSTLWIELGRTRRTCCPSPPVRYGVPPPGCPS